MAVGSAIRAVYSKYIKPLKWVSPRDIVAYHREEPAGGDPSLLRLRISTLRGESVLIRRFSPVDKNVLKYVFYNQFHLPPVELPKSARILDLGANIGLTVRHYKYLYPDSFVVGVEMDRSNCELARANCDGLDGITLLHAAVWITDGVVSYDSAARADGHTVSIDGSNGDLDEVESVTVGTIMERCGVEYVDFLKMDIEGAEIPILTANPDWLQRVGSMNLEVHRATVGEEEQILARLRESGLQAEVALRHGFGIIAISAVRR